MMTKSFSKHQRLITILLVAIMAIGGLVAWSGCSQGQLIEIKPPPSQDPIKQIYVGGAVNVPGFYPLKAGDSLEAFIQAAGGLTSGADLSQLRLYIPQAGEYQGPQKVNINRAPAWLLEALPGIGPTRAEDIISYRNQNGPFSNINELIKIEGIGIATYEQIKHLITVAD